MDLYNCFIIREQRKRHCFELLKEVIVGRREVLEAAYNAPPGPIKLQRNYFSNNPAVDPVLQRVKKRYLIYRFVFSVL